MSGQLDHDDEAEAEAEALLAHLSPEDRALVLQAMANHGLTLAEAIADLTEAGGL
jgi:hypothetical protein